MGNLKKIFKSPKTLTVLLVFIAIILIFIRHYLILELPVFAYIDYVDDDELMVEQALNIKNGEWLGNYKYSTLLKSPVFPMYLALISMLKIPYILSVTFIFAISCCLFIYSIKDVVKNKIGLFLVFCLMLFNPIMFSARFQRVYRNSLTPSLAIILISFLNIVLVNRRDNKISKYLFGIIGTSLVFPFFYYIREDSIWILPLIYFYMILVGGSILYEIIKNKKIAVINIVKIILIFLPLVTLTVFETIIGNINYKYYGQKAINMNNFESLQQVIYTINRVKNDEETFETNPREKMRMLYEYSPTLNSMKDTCEWLQDVMSGREDGSVGDGMFLWMFLSTVSYSGYNTPEEQTRIFENITKEINLAIEQGKIETQELTPIFNDAAGYRFDLKKILIETKNAFELINNYKSFGLMDTYGSLYSSEYFEIRIRYFLEITNDKLLLNNEPNSWKSFGELIKDNQQDYINRMQPKINILNKIRDVYYYISYVVTVLGYTSYIILTIIFIIKIFKKDIKHILNQWMITSGLIGSTFALCFGVAYTTAVKAYVTIDFYLMSAYILNTTFSILSILFLITIIVNKIKDKNKLKVEKTDINLK